MTRFGEITPFWQNLQSLGQFCKGLFYYFTILDRLWQILYAIGQVFIDVNGQMLKKNLAIWSHYIVPIALNMQFCAQSDNAKQATVAGLGDTIKPGTLGFLQLYCMYS